MPNNRKKYYGAIHHQKTSKNPWDITFSNDYPPSRSHLTKAKAEARLKEINVKENFPIKNIIYEYEDQLYCVLTKYQLIKFGVNNLDLVESRIWYATCSWTTKTYYAQTSIRNREQNATTLLFARAMFSNLTKNQSVDHINRDTLDNNPENVRIASLTTQNINRRMSSLNTSGVIGVVYSKSGNAWRARWVDDGRRCSKSFAISIYGESAKDKAIAIRKEKEETLPTYRLALCK